MTSEKKPGVVGRKVAHCPDCKARMVCSIIEKHGLDAVSEIVSLIGCGAFTFDEGADE